MTLFHVPKKEARPAGPLRQATSLHHNFVTGQSKVIESLPGNPSPNDLVQALRATNPDLAKPLRHRHPQLKQLGRRLLSQPAEESPQPRAGGSFFLWEEILAAGTDAPHRGKVLR